MAGAAPGIFNVAGAIELRRKRQAKAALIGFDRPAIEAARLTIEPHDVIFGSLNPTVRVAKRIVVAIIGGTVLVFGIALIVLPGPAISAIPDRKSTRLNSSHVSESRMPS